MNRLENVFSLEVKQNYKKDYLRLTLYWSRFLPTVHIFGKECENFDQTSIERRRILIYIYANLEQRNNQIKLHAI
jgi:hypothetical protein